MEKWFGAAGIGLNEEGELLMVLQGTYKEEKKWSVPSGGKNDWETFEQCCIREIEEETGYKADIVEKIKIKKGVLKEEQLSFEVHYFLVNIVGGTKKIQDPDHLIYEIAWKSIDDLKTLKLTYPEDREFLINFLSRG